MLLVSCQKNSVSLTEEQERQVADSVKFVFQQIVDLTNKLDFKTAAKFFSAGIDSKYVENGHMFQSLAELEASYEQLVPALDFIENKVDAYHIIVLSENAAVVTIPISIRIKAKGLSEYSGQYVWSGAFQKREGRWIIIQSHESWLNYAEALAAMTPPEHNE
jgi:hypothetical protein